MINYNRVLLFFIIFFSQSIYAQIEGIGFAYTQQEAKKEALADLSQNIKSEVRSNLETRIEDKNGNIDKKIMSNIVVRSNLPIMGIETIYSKVNEQYKAIVILKPEKVANLYKTHINNIVKEIDQLTITVQHQEKDKKILTYEKIFSLLDEYERFYTVSTILNIMDITQPKVTRNSIQNEIDKISSKIDSLTLASQILASSFHEKKIYLYPAVLRNYSTVSQFGTVLEKKLKEKIKTVNSLKEASFILSGEYIETKKGIILNYSLMDVDSHEVVKSKTINIDKKALHGIKIKPDYMDFNALLTSGVITSSKLQVSLNSNKGSNNLLFKNEEEVELFVKLNKMGYIYIIGYTQTKINQFSYLLELNEANNDKKFIKFINADDASKWISLGKFTVEAPFGVESLQVIASNKKPLSLPYTTYDEASGYYIISKNIEKALTSTRGLKKKKSNKIEVSEDVISFTTIPQN